jgi:hypothetical protein
MEILKNKWFMIATFISIPILYRFFNFVIFEYPFWVKCHLTGINSNRGNIGIGTYGDMYGGLNAFVSGLAFLGLLVTIGVQIWLHYREQQLKKKEKLDKADNKLIYLDFLVKQSLSEIKVFKTGINDLINHNSLMEKTVTPLNCTDSIEYNKINHIVNEIDQEVFFTAYYQKNNKKTDLITLFESYNNILKSWQLYIKEIEKKVIEYNNEVINLQNAFDILMQKVNHNTEFDSLSFWYDITKDVTWEAVEKRGNPIEIYCQTKADYDTRLQDDIKWKSIEIDAYLDDCSEYFDKLESVREAILSLCNSQLTKFEAFEEKVKEVAIIVPLST